MSPPRRVVLATFGTHGDLHPFLAVALKLREKGFHPVIATSSVYRAKVESLGLEFRRLRPEQDAVERDLGLSRTELIRAVARRPELVLRKMLLPYLRQSYEDSLVALADAALVVTHTTALATKVAAEKLQLPHLGAVLQPMALLSASDPPELAPVPGLMRWIYRGGPRVRRAFIRLMKAVSRSWAAPIDQLRREVGLPARAAHPFFEGQFSEEGALALFSTVLGEPQDDHPVGTAIVGFAFYDADEGGTTTLTPELESFLARGDPPLVFTLGTSAVHDPTDFIKASLAACAALQRRGLFVLDQEQRDRWRAHESESILFSTYAPYSLLFPHAVVVVHHGGVGTTAQALRAGRPQLIAPFLVDQPDNAARIVRLGVGRTLPLRRFRARRVIKVLQTILADRQMQSRALQIATRVMAEDGAGHAVRVIERILERSAQRSDQRQNQRSGNRRQCGG